MRRQLTLKGSDRRTLNRRASHPSFISKTLKFGMNQQRAKKTNKRNEVLLAIGKTQGTMTYLCKVSMTKRSLFWIQYGRNWPLDRSRIRKRVPNGGNLPKKSCTAHICRPLTRMDRLSQLSIAAVKLLWARDLTRNRPLQQDIQIDKGKIQRIKINREDHYTSQSQAALDDNELPTLVTPRLCW